MGRVIELFVDQFLAIDQGFPVNNPQGVYVSQTLVLTDTAKNYRTMIEVSQLLNFGQEALARRSIYNISVAQYLPFYQKGGSGPELLTITQFFGMFQSVYHGPYEILIDTLVLTQSATVTLSKSAINTLIMTDEASYNIIKTIVVLHTLVIGSHSNAYIFDEEFFSIELPTLTGSNTPEC